MGRKSQKSEKSTSIKETIIPSKVLGKKQRKPIYLYTKFVLIDMKFRFGELDVRYNTVKFQSIMKRIVIVLFYPLHFDSSFLRKNLIWITKVISIKWQVLT